MFSKYITNEDTINPSHNAEISKRLCISPEVQDALDKHKPIVALESTIITHGMDYPVNLQTALEVESQVRENGAIPATIAIIAGKIHVGLDKKTIEYLATLPRSQVRKCSRRDLAYILAHKENGSTTVAATMYIAHLAGIKIFATGGIGGVHRGAETTFDISADLVELSKTPVAVVSAGVKSILDIPKTLELLETLGVPVISYGSEWFPDFYTDNSGLKAPFKADTPEECAKIIEEGHALNLENGLLIGVPVPKGKGADPAHIKSAISEAIDESLKKGIKGAAVTPFLLKKVADLTSGESVKSNIELIKNNAKIAAQISVKIMELYYNYCQKYDVVLCGGSNIDIIGKSIHFEKDNSNIGKVSFIPGGCTQNIMGCLHKLQYSKMLFLTSIGQDEFGEKLQKIFEDQRLKKEGIYINNDYKTGTYMCIMDENKNANGISDMEIHEKIPISHFAKFEKEINNSKILGLDANLSIEVLNYLCEIGKNCFITFDPISEEKTMKLLEKNLLARVSLLKGNKKQMKTLVNKITGNNEELTDEKIIENLENYFKKLSEPIKLQYILITSSENIMLGIYANKKFNVMNFQVEKIPKEKIIKTGGAGDALLAGIIYEMANNGINIENLKKGIEMGKKMAILSITSQYNVNPDMELAKIKL